MYHLVISRHRKHRVFTAIDPTCVTAQLIQQVLSQTSLNILNMHLMMRSPWLSARQWLSPHAMSTMRMFWRSSMSRGLSDVDSDEPKPRQEPQPQEYNCQVHTHMLNHQEYNCQVHTHMLNHQEYNCQVHTHMLNHQEYNCQVHTHTVNHQEYNCQVHVHSHMLNQLRKTSWAGFLLIIYYIIQALWKQFFSKKILKKHWYIHLRILNSNIKGGSLHVP